MKFTSNALKSNNPRILLLWIAGSLSPSARNIDQQWGHLLFIISCREILTCKIRFTCDLGFEGMNFASYGESSVLYTLLRTSINLSNLDSWRIRSNCLVFI